MPLELLISRTIDSDAANDLVRALKDQARPLALDNAILYYGYPRFRDENDDLVVSQLLLVSERHGAVVIVTSDSTERDREELERAASTAEAVLSQLHAKFLQNRVLRRTAFQLKFEMRAYVFCPRVSKPLKDTESVVHLVREADVISMLGKQRPFDAELLPQILATVDGSNRIPRPKKRDLGDLNDDAKGKIVARLESALAQFDAKQREGSLTNITGPQRIRGLAGSGKTIILTRKAALTHLDSPDASIVYTFHTKSLYQQIQRLVTRFYRAEHDQDPDWNHLEILHSWGGSATPGVYSVACERFGVTPLSLDEAKKADPISPFGYACRMLLETGRVTPIFDYVFIDEGQDSPKEFVQLCAQLTHDQKFVYAYDDLQSIFQARAPDAAAIFGLDKAGNTRAKFERDIVLYKCYRNPRDILVCAHAVGLGVYGTPVQMLEDESHWNDVGYVVEKGPLVEGQKVRIRRPNENSIPLLTELQTLDELLQVQVCPTPEEEVEVVAKAIRSQMDEGLRADDIVVISADDRNARYYFSKLASALSKLEIKCNNIHETFGVPDFQVEGRVTLTTVHKAKGNEAFAVHVVGADALFHIQTKKNRNLLFTAMTRAKGWLRITGCGKAATDLKEEIEKAKRNAPCLIFKYPSEAELEMVKRDLDEKSRSLNERERYLDSIPEAELEGYLTRRRRTPRKR